MPHEVLQLELERGLLLDRVEFGLDDVPCERVADGNAAQRKYYELRKLPDAPATAAHPADSYTASRATTTSSSSVRLRADMIATASVRTET